jgi:mRNA-degrading endonuclease toxin of MazEF toxin-antitoxin module
MMWSSRRLYLCSNLWFVTAHRKKRFRNIHTTFRRVMRFSTFFAGPLLNLKRGMRPAVVLIADQLDAPRSLIIHIPITRQNRGNEFDIGSSPQHKQSVKAVKKTDARKTPGTLAVEKHRPLMNKLTVARRQHLRQRAAELLYGHGC